MSDKSLMYAAGESHDCVVPAKAPNKEPQGTAEGLEGRRSIKENAGEANPSRTQSREIGSRGLEGVREAARRDKELRFTAVLHHVTERLLLDSFYSLQRQAAPGVDRVTWQEYEPGVEARIKDLHNRVHRGAYRAQPSRRFYIPKPDGRQRPLGMAALEDKIVQQAVAAVFRMSGTDPQPGVPARAGRPRCIGCPVGGDRVEEGELDSRCGCPGLFR
jgi:RNA-directed DNA polymerase